MAYQKLQGSSLLTVIPSDNANIPTNSKPLVGTNTSVIANQLIDATNDQFLVNVVMPGDIVYNLTDSLAAVVDSVDVASAGTTVRLNANIFAATGKSYAIYRPETQGAVLYVGGDGNLSVTTASGTSAVFVGLAAGTFLPVNVVKVNATGTTATNIIAIW